MNKYQEALNEMYAVLNDSERWHEKKALLQELVDRATPNEPKVLSQDILCGKCGSSVGNNGWTQVEFCRYCGTRID